MTSPRRVTTGILQLSDDTIPAVLTAGIIEAHCTVRFTGHVIIGGVLSCTTIVALHCALLPQSSVAVHVLVTLYDCGHNPGIVTSKKVTFTVASQASKTVGVPKFGVCPHCIGLT